MIVLVQINVTIDCNPDDHMNCHNKFCIESNSWIYQNQTSEIFQKVLSLKEKEYFSKYAQMYGILRTNRSQNPLSGLFYPRLTSNI